jgi:ABC-type polysaccharide/polyol phosphate export permease|tara:strand:+ start:978 stop:1793 length:816 start_codon:yes stop_codon:yes gene_type:complete
MERIITHESCLEKGKFGLEEKRLDNVRISFVLRTRFRNFAGRQKLGVAWMVIDPIVTSIIYLFVFTVIRSNPSPESLFIGLTLMKILSSSIRSGVDAVGDFSGGIVAERVRTRVLVLSSFYYRIIDNSLQSVGVALILLIFFKVDSTGVLAFILISQIIGILGEGFGLNLASLARRIPDFRNFVNYFLLLLFYGSPALYPMSVTTGIHYRINEFNPYSYFVESSRYFAGLDSVILDLDWKIFASMVAILILLTFRGYSGIDGLRWKVTTWP